MTNWKRIGLVFVVLAMLTTPIAAQEAVDDLLIEDWAFGASEDPEIRGLYPNAQFLENPALLVDFEETYLLPVVFLDLSGNRDTTTGTNESEDAGGGLEGGVDESRSSGVGINSVGGRYFSPSDGATYGGDFFFSSQKEDEVETRDGFNAADEDFTEEEITSRSWSLYGTGFAAFELNGFDFGSSLGASFEREPADVLGVVITEDGTSRRDEPALDPTDKNAVDDVLYTPDPDDQDSTVGVDKARYSIRATPGIRLPMGEGSVGIGVETEFSQRSLMPYVIADKEGDGNPEDFEPVSIEEFVLNDDWGEGESDFQYLRRRRNTRVVLQPQFIFPVSGNLDLVGSGDLTVFGVDRFENYGRRDSDSEAKFTRDRVSTFREYGLSSGISYSPSSRWNLRVGGGFSHEGEAIDNESLGYDGEEPDSNPQFLPEQSDPSDREIKRNGNTVRESQTDVFAGAGLKFAPINGLTLYTRGELTTTFDRDTRAIFDTDTDEEVEATIGGSDIRFGADYTVGGAVQLTEGMLVGMNANLLRNGLIFSRGAGDTITGDLEERENVGWNTTVELAAVLSF